MYPSNVFALVNVATLQALLGSPVRVYPFGEAPADAAKPYVTHQLVTAVPDNNVDDPPEIDDERVQFTIWADDSATTSGPAKAYQIAAALRLVLEDAGTVNTYQTLGRDLETGLFGYLIDWSRLETVR